MTVFQQDMKIKNVLAFHVLPTYHTVPLFVIFIRWFANNSFCRHLDSTV